MPHCIIEYADQILSNTSQQQLIDTVLSGSKKSGLFELDHIKLRTQSYKNYQKGGVKNFAFIHVCNKLP